MRIVVVDIETLPYDWVAVFYDISSGQWYDFHNDNAALRDFMLEPDTIYCGFNNKHFDNHCLKAICCGASPQLVKEIANFIIVEDNPGWEHWFLKTHRFWFDSFDLADDTQQGTSLKKIEAHMGWSIVETPIDFDTPRPLTKKEIEEITYYCKWDVKATAKLLTLRKGYLEAKLNVARMKGIPDKKALYMTNARLTAAFLDATYEPRFDEREYRYPNNLDRDLIPQEVFDFFDLLHDDTIPDNVVFKSELTLDVDGAEAKVAYGGIHHARKCYSEKSAPNRIIRNFDVASLYPSLMIYNGFTSRNIPSADTFKDVYDTRLRAKFSGDKHTANTLKLILNTTYGASLASTNPLYDPLMGRSVCITGQLYILELAMRYLRECKTVRIIQLNTDGLMISLDPEELPKVYEINDDWQRSKHLTLEEDVIKSVTQKDVNNYVMEFESGKIKTKGSYVTYGIPPAGAFSINNTHTIVKKAVIDFFTKGIPVEDTIYGCKDIFEFQIIAQAGSDYKAVYRVPPDFEDYKKEWQYEHRYRVLNNKGKYVWKKPPFRWDDYTGPRSNVQKVNRVYASLIPNMGTLRKVKYDGSIALIGGLPESCVIDNDNHLTLDQIDVKWYVEQAKKYIADYLGEKKYG